MLWLILNKHNFLIIPQCFVRKVGKLWRHLYLSTFQAGIIEEMLEDTFESMEDGEEMEEAAEEEVDKILFDLTAGTNL